MPKKKDKDSMSPKKRNMKKNKNDDSDPEIDEISENEEYNDLEFHKMLSSMFPSKMQNEKVKKKEALNKLKKNTKKSKKRRTTKRKKSKSKKISKKKKEEEKIDDEWEDDEDDEDYIPEEEEDVSDSDEEVDEDYIPEEDEDYDDEEEYDDEETEILGGKGMKFNIIFTNSAEGNNDWYEYYDKKYDDEIEDEEDVSDSDEEAEDLDMTKEEYKLHKKEESKSELKKGDKVKVKLKDWDKYYKGTIIKVNKPGSKNKNRRRTMTSRSKSYNIELDDDEYETIEYVLPKFIKKIDTIDHDKALKELNRVLKSDGHLLIQVPLKKGETYQDNSIISKEGRLKAFGQEDHVRVYGEDSLPLILNENGFSAKPIDIVREYNSEEKKIYGFSKNEVIYVCRKATST